MGEKREGEGVLLIRLSVLGRPFLPPPALEAGVVENGAAAREGDALGVARGEGRSRLLALVGRCYMDGEGSERRARVHCVLVMDAW